MDDEAQMDDGGCGYQVPATNDDYLLLLLDNFRLNISSEMEVMTQSIASYLTIKDRQFGAPRMSESESGHSKVGEELKKAELLIRILNASASISRSIHEMQASKK